MHGTVKASYRGTQRTHPEKEIDDVAEAAAQPGNGLEKDGKAGDNQHDRQRDEDKRRHKLSEMESQIFLADKLHPDGSHTP